MQPRSTNQLAEDASEAHVWGEGRRLFRTYPINTAQVLQAGERPIALTMLHDSLGYGRANSWQLLECFYRSCVHIDLANRSMALFGIALPFSYARRPGRAPAHGGRRYSRDINARPWVILLRPFLHRHVYRVPIVEAAGEVDAVQVSVRSSAAGRPYRIQCSGPGGNAVQAGTGNCSTDLDKCCGGV